MNMRSSLEAHQAKESLSRWPLQRTQALVFFLTTAITLQKICGSIFSFIRSAEVGISQHQLDLINSNHYD